MTVARNLTVGYVAVCTVLAAVLYTYWTVARMRLAFWRWRLARAERFSVVLEADAIAEVAARVRLDSPPMPAMFLAECVSNGIEETKAMGL